MPTQTQPWLRAELIAAPETTPGAQLMIPADGVEFHDDQLVFHHQGEVVYVAPQGQLRSITWFARQPNPETARRKAQWPNHGTRWTDEERADLQNHLRTGHSWKTISHAHGRSRTGCQQEAIKQGWLDPDTLRPTPQLLLSTIRGDTAAETESSNQDTALISADNTSSPNPATSTYATPAAAPTAADAPPNIALAAAPTDAPPAPALTAARADSTPAPATTPATASSDSTPGPVPPATHTGPSPKTELVAARSGPNIIALPSAPTAEATKLTIATPAAARPAAKSPTTTAKPAAEPASEPVLATAGEAAARTTDIKPAAPRHAVAPDAAAFEPVAADRLPTNPLASDPLPTNPLASDPLMSDIAMPLPDRPRIPPRVPPQRTPTADPQPSPSPAGDTDKDADPDSGPSSTPGPGSRFLSRAQSSLARAALGAYMNPPRGQSGAASGAT